MQSILRPALVLFAALTLVCGLLYPLFVTGVAQAAFPAQANGSLVERETSAGKQLNRRIVITVLDQHY